ncbi:MAG TPA: response regulator [Chryseosolibacter sp.]|nr:response regulator [Chryseosolibacter sp.]
MVILYVDDDPEDIEIFIEAARENDPTIKCLIAQDGSQAMDILGAALLPDLVFLDINMPVINGRALLAEIRKDSRFDEVPIVMYSTTITPKEREEYKKMGANHFLIKHNHFQDLCDALSDIIKAKVR